MIKRVDSKINVETWPMKVMRTGETDFRQFSDRRVAKPGEIFKREKAFSLVNEQPETMRRHIRHLNGRSVSSTPRGQFAFPF
jgi:hypothetical protein